MEDTVTESKKSIRTFKDVLGRTIKVNDTVAYPVRRRSTMVLYTATVTELADDHLVCLKDNTATIVKLRHPKRCAIVRLIEDR